MVSQVFSTRSATGGAQTAQDIFQGRLKEALEAGRPVQILTDFDGTLFPFSQDPDDVEIDTNCYAALQKLATFPNVRITGLTGRDVTKARQMVRDLPVEIIGSHGVECEDYNGNLVRHDFGQEQTARISECQKKARELEEKFPRIKIEADKHGCVGINVALVPEADRQNAYDTALQLLETYQNDTFGIAKEGDLEMELRPIGFGKDFGIKEFVKPDRNALTIFLCDSLGDHGTDRVAAALINNKKEFSDGHVIMVLNGRDCPPEQSKDYAPFAVFDSPAHLGKALKGVVDSEFGMASKENFFGAQPLIPVVT